MPTEERRLPVVDLAGHAHAICVYRDPARLLDDRGRPVSLVRDGEYRVDETGEVLLGVLELAPPRVG